MDDLKGKWQVKLKLDGRMGSSQPQPYTRVVNDGTDIQMIS